MRIIMRTILHQRFVMPRSVDKLPKSKALKVAEPKMSYGSAKQRLNVTVRADLIERARAAKLNLSSVIEESLELKLRKTEGERWAEENAEAIAYHNARIERDGMWNRDLIRF